MLLILWAKTATYVMARPTIWTQDLNDRQQLDSSMSLTFSQELLLGNPKDFGPWDFFMEPGSLLTRRREKSQNPRSGLGLPSKQPPLRSAARRRGKTAPTHGKAQGMD